MEILTETPWWVYLLFVFLVVIGLKATQPRTTSSRRLILLPAIFTIWNILWLTARVHERFDLSVFWIGGLVIGFPLGWLSVRSWMVHVDRIRHIITLPGAWSTLVLILLVFVVRYFFTYNYEAHPTLAPHYFMADAAISGVITGIFIGRSVHLYRKYRTQNENH